MAGEVGASVVLWWAR